MELNEQGVPGWHGSNSDGNLRYACRQCLLEPLQCSGTAWKVHLEVWELSHGGYVDDSSLDDDHHDLNGGGHLLYGYHGVNAGDHAFDDDAVCVLARPSCTMASDPRKPRYHSEKTQVQACKIHSWRSIQFVRGVLKSVRKCFLLCDHRGEFFVEKNSIVADRIVSAASGCPVRIFVGKTLG